MFSLLGMLCILPIILKQGFMALYFQEFGEADGPSAPLVIVHGLFGSSVNWRAMARKLAENRKVYTVDMRNHGKSPHMDIMSYEAMAMDLVRFMDSAGLKQADIVGHSMGGKAAMVAALLYPEHVKSMAILDIAPVTYTHSYTEMLNAMLAIDMEKCSSRSEVEEKLKKGIPDDSTRLFIMQNVVAGDDGLAWRLNLPVLIEYMDDIIGFPAELVEARRYEGNVAMIYGKNSDYVKASAGPVVRDYFPNSEFISVDEAGHWIQVDQPEVLLELLQNHLN
jgi:esterase